MKFVVAREGEIEEGGHKLVTVAGREIGVFFVDGEYFALRHRCPHQGGPLCAGHLHVRTGRSWFDPAKQRVKRYPVTLEAETYPVEVDRRAIVVTID
jgi:3-phenylpropionate/trans-cinnamate dioxygenase ferredoxin subunit